VCNGFTAQCLLVLDISKSVAFFCHSRSWRGPRACSAVPGLQEAIVAEALDRGLQVVRVGDWGIAASRVSIVWQSAIKIQARNIHFAENHSSRDIPPSRRISEIRFVPIARLWRLGMRIK